MQSSVRRTSRITQSTPWAASAACCGSGATNVGDAERLFSLLGGGMLLAYGLSRGSTAGLGLGLIGAGFAYRGWSGHCHAYQALGMSTAGQNDRTSIPSGQGIKFEEKVTIARPADELFRFWRKLDNLPGIMRHLVSVQDIGNGRSRWTAKGPTGNVQWDAEIITERPGELLGWRSLEGSTVDTAGSVHFRESPDGRATEVEVVLSYNPPGGQLGHSLAWLTGMDPGAEIRKDLQNFKRAMERPATTASSPPATMSAATIPATPTAAAAHAEGRH